MVGHSSKLFVTLSLGVGSFMKRPVTIAALVLIAAALVFVSVYDFRRGAVMQKAPDFTAEASLAGKAFTFKLSDALKKGPVVVYFYPSAYTPGCNIQAHVFSQNMDKFAAAGASVIGVSLDGIDRLNSFSADPDFCAGKFPVASDVDGKITAAYGLKVKFAEGEVKDSRGQTIHHGFAERVTFVVAPDGNIAATITTDKETGPKGNVENALAAVQKMKN
jgi:peroxiredoxin